MRLTTGIGGISSISILEHLKVKFSLNKAWFVATWCDL